MKPNRARPNFSMYLDDEIREKINEKINKGHYTSVSSYLRTIAMRDLKINP